MANAGRPTRDLNLCHPASYRPLLTCPRTINVRAATRGFRVPGRTADLLKGKIFVLRDILGLMYMNLSLDDI